ncbi:MAG TPA: gamma-glutamyltransferase family protein [Wenzhouxiangella sp.]|nr:gamma-glutamyltransferase family protein [Wenzhouxiangella sp.]
MTRNVFRPSRMMIGLLLVAGLAACALPAREVQDVSEGTEQQMSAVKVTAGVAAAHPLAVEAGLAVLSNGGSAADAAVAVQAMLGLVEPQSSGIGGGAFLLHYSAADDEVTAFSGRETAPAGATADMFIGDDGEPLGWFEAIVGGRAVGVPGIMPMLGEAHSRFGRLPWSKLFDATIDAAEGGFEVPQRLARFAGGGRWPQAQVSDVIELFTNDAGTTITAGEIWRNPAYGQTLRQMAEGGPRTLLEPPISTRIIERSAQPPLPGTLAQQDFDAYRPAVTAAICGGFLDYRVCVPPPPSSGVALLQMLAILDHTDIDQRGPDDPTAWLQFAEASRLMYADRNRYVADPDFADVPVTGLLDPDYVAERAEMIGERAGPLPEAGTPPGFAWASDERFRRTGTSHFVVVDEDGNVVTMTTSVESIFGTGRTVGGFFLNNQLTDFSFRSEIDGRAVANAVEPGKRPRSSMTPVLVFDENDRLVAALGSPGGSAILAYNAKAIVGLLAWNLTLQEAIDLPNLVTLGENFYGEASKFPEEVLTGLAELGVEVQPGRGEESGLHGAVFYSDGQVDGAADPRREGTWKTLAE